MQHHGAVRPESEERRHSEIDVTGVASQDIPGRRQHDILEHDIAGEEHVGVVDQPGSREGCSRHYQRKQKKSNIPHQRRPNRPAGRTASVINRNPNPTAGDHEGP